MKQLGKDLLILDGAMGTMLQSRGLPPGESTELWNLTHPGEVAAVHEAYAAAGADILTANTFGASRYKLVGSGHTPAQVITAGVHLALQAANALTSSLPGENPTVPAATPTPTTPARPDAVLQSERRIAGPGRTITATRPLVAMDIGPLGRLLAPYGDLDFEEAVAAFSEMAAAGAKAGSDLILIETMTDTYEIKAAILGAREACDLPIFVSFAPDENGRLLTGASILATVALAESLGASAVGMNCGLGPTQMATLLPQLTAAASIPVLLSPNAGMPLMQGNRTYYNVGPSEFATAMARLAPQLHVAGGCCGTTPEHIAALTAACRSVRPTPPAPKHRTLVTSFAQAVEIGGQTGPVLVGERINPTGKPRLKQALHDGDMDYLYRMALDQTAAGAQVLDVNVGVPGTNEPALLTRAITGIQAVCGAPLQVDTANPDAAAAALRLYNGKPLFNSVDGRPEHLATILPLVQRYGACLVALALDEQGVPETWQGRFKVAERIIAAAEAAGIPRSNVVVDALTMTVSTDVSNARTTLAALKHIHNELGVCTVLGVSNVSFGLPRRSLLNASFLLMALESGLNAAIVNPQDPAIRAALAAHRTLSAQDEACINYIAFATTLDSTGATSVPVLDTPIQESMASKVGLQPFNDHVSGLDDTTGTPQPLNAASSSLAAPSPLHRAVVQGLRESAARAATELLAAPGASPLAVINEHLIPALDDVGAAFGAKRLYLPQLLASAEAAKSAFEVIKRHLAAHGAAGTPRGKVVLATVQGDVHDIGKNIVKVLLENYNFQVIDLGKNVDPELVLQQARDNNVSLVGLSALMTTSLPAMERTIGLLHEQLPGCHIMVGGAVLTANYAAQIGADFYGKDALASVRYAESLMPEL